MRLGIGYDIGYRFEQPTPLIAVLSVHYSRAADLERLDAVLTTPSIPMTAYRDAFGNWCHRMVAPAGDFSLHTDTVIRDPGAPDQPPRSGVQVPVENLPDETLVYLLASRFCESDRLASTAWELFGQRAQGWSLVTDIAEYVHRKITFDYLATGPTKSALEAFEHGRGVCRDFAHLGVALCRAMNVPARYCTGYLGDIGVPPSPDPMDFSGWFEVYLSDGWYTVDPRNLHPRIGRVLIARGRDAADVAMTTTFGPNLLTSFAVRTDQLDDAPSGS